MLIYEAKGSYDTATPRLRPHNPRVTDIMSPTTDNFIHSLVEMSKAFEELPTVRSELDQAKHENASYLDMVREREESILKLKAELEASHEARRKVEAERDDAELRFLELDEKAHKALAALGNIMANVNDATRDLTPPAPPQPEPEPKPEPAPTPEPKAIDNPMYGDPQQGQGEPHPTSTNISEPGSTAQGDTHSSEQTSSEVPKSDANPPTPTASSTAGDGHSPSTATPTSTAQPIGDAPSQAQTPIQPYAGKRYYDHPTYLTRDAWHAGGGSDADYDWRPGRGVGF